MWTEIRFFQEALPAPAPLPEAARGGCGAWAEFRGYVRGEENGRRIAALRYEIYAPMARQRLDAHFQELALRHPVQAIRFWHREGVVPVGEASVYAAAAAPHRREALAALAEVMELLKKDVPIWKAEIFYA
jgi:molybdopterin synthase catalytic subunit